MNHEQSRLQGKAGKAIDIVTLSRSGSTPRGSNLLQVPALACCGAIVHTTSAADGCRTTTLSKHFSTDPACHTSHTGKHLRTSTTNWSTQGTVVRNATLRLRMTLPWRLQGSRRTDTSAPRDPSLRCQLVPQSGTELRGRVVIPELQEKAHDGTVTEARMDVVVWRPGGLERWMIDVRTVDGTCATAVALGGTEGFSSAQETNAMQTL